MPNETPSDPKAPCSCAKPLKLVDAIAPKDWPSALRIAALEDRPEGLEAA